MPQKKLCNNLFYKKFIKGESNYIYIYNVIYKLVAYISEWPTLKTYQKPKNRSLISQQQLNNKLYN